MTRKKPTEVVLVERNDSSARWLFWGALLGAGLALLYAPRSGEETRRSLQRRLRRLRAATEERMDEFMERFAPGDRRAPAVEDEFDDIDDDTVEATVAPPRAAELSPREEIERRLADARARRRREAAPVVPEEPSA